MAWLLSIRQIGNERKVGKCLKCLCITWAAQIGYGIKFDKEIKQGVWSSIYEQWTKVSQK